MKFKVERASGPFHPTQPCPEAFQVGEEWMVEITDIDALMTFINTHGDLVIRNRPSYRPGPTPEIIIYDDYIE